MSGKKWKPNYWALVMAWGLFLGLVLIIEYFIK